MKTLVLDIGGKLIRSALWEDGSLQDVREISSDARQGGPAVLKRAKALAASCQKRNAFDCIAVSTAGQLDARSGQILFANENMPRYTGTNLKEFFETAFHCPVKVENNVYAAALGEAALGAGKGESSFVFLNYDVGIGGALFLDGRLYRGSLLTGTEFGGIITHSDHRNPAADFFSGCYEKYASASALIRRASEIDPDFQTIEDIMLQLEEPAVHAIVDLWITEVVYGLVTTIHMLNPGCVIMGGRVMEEPYVLDHIRKRLSQRLMPSFRHTVLKSASLGRLAGLYGAALLAEETLK